MGGKSTSDSAVLDDKRPEGSSSFDLRSWQGLTEVLRAGKDALSANDYAEFRNLILGYAQQGGDVEIRAHIDKIIATFGTARSDVVPEKHATGNATESVKPSLVHPSGIGVQRMQPRFVVSSRSIVEAEKVSTKVIVPPTPITQNEVPHIKEKPVIPPPHPSIAEELLHEAQVLPNIATPEPVVVPAVFAPEPIPNTSSASLEESKARITQIKRDVHEHIGNPVALIDTHNEAGKKYMTSLLSALKATGSGSTEGVGTAMHELESAYKELTSNVPPEEPIEEKIESVLAPEPFVLTMPVVEIQEEPVLDVVEVLPEIIPEPVVETATEIDVEEKEEGEPVKHSAASTLASILKQQPKSHDIQPAPKVDEAVGREPYLANEKRWESEGGAFPQTKHAHKGIAATNLDAIKVETGIDASNIAVRQSELSAPEITKELHDLLHEWKIFSGSGLFGIGPGGSEHPLYLKIAQLSMGEVLAGRWDASDPKVVKTIKEYVNAWRHEQGVAHSVDETFEHYLRRVVQRILKRRS